MIRILKLIDILNNNIHDRNLMLCILNCKIYVKRDKIIILKITSIISDLQKVQVNKIIYEIKNNIIHDVFLTHLLYIN